ncbi:MAG: CgeB family protein, partial [Janthinobacterium lividum]
LPAGGSLRLYRSFEEIRAEAKRVLQEADLALVTSYCPDGPEASELVLECANGVRAFYDMDTPVTLDSLETGAEVGYLPEQGLSGFDLVLSFTGGRALEELRSRLGARVVAPLYGSVNPLAHHPVEAVEGFRAELSYLGTYAEDRQATLERLFIQPAQQRPERRFLIGGAQYPESFPWTENIFFTGHLEPAQHPAFFCSGRATLNVTRRAMAEYGFCPSGRLFEAAACGVPLFTDGWEGLDEFFTPGTEILRVDTAEEVLNTLSLSDTELGQVAAAARERVLREHTADCRVRDLERILEQVRSRAEPAIEPAAAAQA